MKDFLLDAGKVEEALSLSLKKYRPRIYDFTEISLREMFNREIRELNKYFNSNWLVEAVNTNYEMETEGLKGEPDLVLRLGDRLLVIDFKISNTDKEVWDMLYFSSIQWAVYLFLTGAEEFQFHLIKEDKVLILKLTKYDNEKLYKELLQTAQRAKFGIKRAFETNLWIKTGACYDSRESDSLCPFFNACVMNDKLVFKGKEDGVKYELNVTEKDGSRLEKELVLIRQSQMKTYIQCPRKLYYQLMLEENGVPSKASNSQKLGSVLGDMLGEYCRQVFLYQQSSL